MIKTPKLEHRQLTEHVIQIGDSVGNACTLVIGEEHSLLFDTMTGTCDLKQYVKEITDLPLTVVLSHGHFDHSYGSWQFGEVYLNAQERQVYEKSQTLLPEIVQNTKAVLPEQLRNGSFDLIFHDLKEGDLFPLGSITAEAVSLPGHTRGSIGLLLREERTLLVGDAVSPQMTLLFEESLPVSTYLETLSKSADLPADRIIGSHFMKAFPVSAIGIFEDCARSIGKIRGMKYVFSPVPEYKGTLWLYEIHNPLIDETICIITKR